MDTIFILSPPIPHIETMASIFIKCSLLDITKKKNRFKGASSPKTQINNYYNNFIKYIQI